MNPKNILVAGHRGMVGSAIVRALERQDGYRIITRTREELNLCDREAVQAFFESERIDAIYLSAARVGGILANNSYPAEFIHDNLMLECTVIHAAHLAGIRQLLFLGSSCAYPKDSPQPIPETALLQGPLEPTNEPYAIAKIAGIKLCESYARQYGHDYRSVMPSNLYGPNDNFHPEHSHVVPALLRRFYEAVENGTREVTIWGSGKPLREFLHVDDLAAACVYVMNLPREVYEKNTSPMLSHINIGTGQDCSIRELAETIARVTGFKGHLSFDTDKPDGTSRKLLDVSLLTRLGWRASIPLEDGLRDTYRWFIENLERIRT